MGESSCLDLLFFHLLQLSVEIWCSSKGIFQTKSLITAVDCLFSSLSFRRVPEEISARNSDLE